MMPGLPGTCQPVVLLCTDVSDIGPDRVAASAIAAEVRARAPGLRVAAVPHLCSRPAGLPAALRAAGVQRVVVGCRRAATRREEIIGRLLRAGISRPGIAVVDLMPGGRPGELRVTAQSAARIAAAAARAGNADLDSSAGELALASGPVSRRNIFHRATIGPRPVARWPAGRCPGGDGCRTCASACPHGALHVTGSGVTVDPAACTGCGACLTACHAGALTVSGLPIGAFEAAAGVLVAEARRPGPGGVDGVAIACERAAVQLPVGADWLPLEVPSLEMASAGWLLQILGAGVGVALAGCDDDACARHGRDIGSLCDALAPEYAHGWRRLGGRFAGWEPVDSGRLVPDTPARAVQLRFREPAATARALSALLPRATGAAIGTPGAAPASPSPGIRQARQWRLEAQAAPLGEITVDPARCSACGNCARACPTGALTAADRDGAALVLSFDASQCSACGACVSACPERAVSMRRVLDSASLTAGRQTVGEVTVGSRCESCGRPLAAGLASGIIGLRLAASHPGIAGRLRRERRCTDCLLMGSRPVHMDQAVGQHDHRPGPAPHRLRCSLAGDEGVSEVAVRKPAEVVPVLHGDRLIQAEPDVDQVQDFRRGGLTSDLPGQGVGGSEEEEQEGEKADQPEHEQAGHGPVGGGLDLGPAGPGLIVGRRLRCLGPRQELVRMTSRWVARVIAT